MLKYFYVIVVMVCIISCTKHNYYYELEKLQDENIELRKNVKFLSNSLMESSKTIQEMSKRYKMNISQRDTLIKYLKIRKNKKWNK